MVRNYENYAVWQRSHELTLAVYRAAARFPSHERFELANQIRRAAASVPTNIAEGSARGGDREFARFLRIARGSASELHYQLRLAADLRYLSAEEHQTLATETAEVRRMLTKLEQAVSADG